MFELKPKERIDRLAERLLKRGRRMSRHNQEREAPLSPIAPNQPLRMGLAEWLLLLALSALWGGTFFF